MDFLLSLLIITLFWFSNGEVHSASELLRLAEVLPKECGERFNEHRIIGGNDADLGQYPWIARIGYSTTNCSDPDKFVCAGSLITDRYIVTAAHCITDVTIIPCNSKPGEYGLMKLKSILLGQHDDRTYIDCVGDLCAPPAQYFRIFRAVYHEQYNHLSNRNDIAVMEMDRPAILNDFVFPICLPMESVRPTVGSMLDVAGWGMTDMSKKVVARTLQRVSVPLVANAVCSKVLESNDIEIDDTQICAGGVAKKDTCTGDSGGPLMQVSVQNGAAPRVYLMGVVSFGTTDCGTDGFPAVYTDVYKFMDWILNHIQN